MTFNMNNGRARFFHIKDIDTRANLCKHIFYPETIKNHNGAVATRNVFVGCKRNQQIHQFKKGQHGRI